MSISAIKGIYHKGKIEPLEDIPYAEDKKVIIVFLDGKERDDKIWDESVVKDFVAGYSDKDIAYDKL